MPAVLAKTSDAKTADHDPQKPLLDVARPKAAHAVDAALLRMVAETKASPLKIMRDYVGLSFGPGKVSFKDYTQLRLFDEAFWAGADRKAVIGQHRGVEIHQQVNYRHEWWGLFDNKIAMASYLAAYGFPTIPVLAVYCENLGTAAPHVARNPEELRRVLKDESNYPMFGKPTEGLQSLGSVGLKRFAASAQCLETTDGRVIALDAFVADIVKHYADGYLFQKFASPHSAIRALCGDRLPTIRIVTLNLDGGPRVFRACWKIPAGDNIADNYWRDGNLLAQIDIAKGTVLRVLSGAGLGVAHHIVHPDTKVRMIGFEIPHWDAMVATVVEAARLMQHVPLIGWDVAALESGPVIVEMNERPDFFLPQLADARGILDDTLTDFLAVQKRKAAEWRKGNKSALKEL
jgi:putative polysaccharide biosynthesis protein